MTPKELAAIQKKKLRLKEETEVLKKVMGMLAPVLTIKASNCRFCRNLLTFYKNNSMSNPIISLN
ncbi:hypothetical protein UP17_17160 [Peribacillus simplex]|nr:hypothetical protein UP17_17160 [Peribacillus simplex]